MLNSRSFSYSFQFKYTVSRQEENINNFSLIKSKLYQEPNRSVVSKVKVASWMLKIGERFIRNQRVNHLSALHMIVHKQIKQIVKGTRKKYRLLLKLGTFINNLFSFFFLYIFNLLYCFHFPNKQMSSRLKWTSEEEQLLKTLGSCDRKNKWTHIARMINQQLPAILRTPKQCRQKYNNHLIFGQKLLDGNWTQMEEEALFREYRDQGPKWKKISQNFPTKSQNTIKNRFYGNVRKIVRKLNKIGKQKISKSFKPIKEKSIIRIIEPDCGLPQQAQKIIEQMQSLREKLLDVIQKGIYEDESEQSQKIQDYIGLIKQIHKFNCTCRFYRNFKQKVNRKNSRTNKNNQINNMKNSTQANSSNSGSDENMKDSEDCESQSDSQMLQENENQEINITIEEKVKSPLDIAVLLSKNEQIREDVGIERAKLDHILQHNEDQKDKMNGALQNGRKQQNARVMKNIGVPGSKNQNCNHFIHAVFCFVREYCQNKDKEYLKWLTL